jgi:NitT/TauT family transport system permease protein
LASGLQLAVARGLIGVIIGEMYSAYNGGLGYEIAVAGAGVSIDRMFVAVATITGFGIILMGLMAGLERRLQHWKPKATE